MIKINKLTKSYDRDVIKGLNLNFEKDKTSIIIGPSGSGKTTLFNILAGIEKEYIGEIILSGECSYIFQEDRLIPWLSVQENITLVEEEVHKDRLEKILKLFQIEDKRNEPVKNLSGGEKQRVAVARGFYYKSEIILMDEALKALDIRLKLKIIEEINEFVEGNPRTIVGISHDIREALLLADTIYLFGKEPMELIEKIDVEIPKVERKLYDERIIEIEKYIYHKI